MYIKYSYSLVPVILVAVEICQHLKRVACRRRALSPSTPPHRLYQLGQRGRWHSNNNCRVLLHPPQPMEILQLIYNITININNKNKSESHIYMDLTSQRCIYQGSQVPASRQESRGETFMTWRSVIACAFSLSHITASRGCELA